MDGPWRARLNASEPNRVDVQLLDAHGEPPTEVARVSVKRTDLVERLVSIATTVIAICESNHWASPDLALLRQHVERLRHAPSSEPPTV